MNALKDLTRVMQMQHARIPSDLSHVIAIACILETVKIAQVCKISWIVEFCHPSRLSMGKARMIAI